MLVRLQELEGQDTPKVLVFHLIMDLQTSKAAELRQASVDLVLQQIIPLPEVRQLPQHLAAIEEHRRTSMILRVKYHTPRELKSMKLTGKPNSFQVVMVFPLPRPAEVTPDHLAESQEAHLSLQESVVLLQLEEEVQLDLQEP